MSLRISPYRLPDGTRRYRVIESNGGEVVADTFTSVAEAHSFIKGHAVGRAPTKVPRFDVYVNVGERQVGMGENLTGSGVTEFVYEHLPFLEVGSKVQVVIEKMEAA